MASNGMTQITDKTFKKEVLESDKIVLVDFWAAWCGPCKKLTPILNEIAQDMKDTVHVVKIDVDKNPKTCDKYKITSLPTLLLFKEGKLITNKKGFVPKEKLTKWIKKNC